MGKSTNYMAIFNSTLLVYQRVYYAFIHYLCIVVGYFPLLTIINHQYIIIMSYIIIVHDNYVTVMVNVI